MASPHIDPGELKMLRTEDLLLDWHNPRLRPEEQLDDAKDPDSVGNQTALAIIINKQYNPLRVAESIGRHQYFHSEPMIAVQHGEKFRVIEGNRRLTALLGLQDSSLRAVFAKENREWSSLPAIDLDEKFPVLVVSNAASIAPLLGYRHVAGIEPWAAYAQARYIVSLVEQGHSLAQVADLVGKTETAVRSMYRDYDVLEQASEMFHIDTSGPRKTFGVFSNAMGRQGIRAFIGAPAPRDVDPDRWPIPDTRATRLEELLTFIYGDATGEGRVVTDSRQLGRLAKVLGDPSTRGIRTLRETGDLDASEAAIQDPEQQFATAIASATREAKIALKLASAANPTFDKEIDDLADIVDAVRQRHRQRNSE